MEMTSLPVLPTDMGIHPTGPLEPLPGHDELALVDPPPPPSVPAPPKPKVRSVAMKRSVPPPRALADVEDDDSDEEDDDYKPPSPKARRIEEDNWAASDIYSSTVNSPLLASDAPPVSSELTVPHAVIVKRRKTMDDNVGPQFQAEVPDNPLPLEERGKDLRRELQGELIWEPGTISDEHVSRFLLAVDAVENHLSVDKALNLLRQRHYDVKTLTVDILYGPPGLDLQRRKRRDLLSRQEQKLFREAMSVIGKDFHVIAANMGRSVHDLLEYYYLWKKQKKFHASVEHFPYRCWVDGAIRPPRLTDNSGAPAEKQESAESSEESSDSSANCQQS